MRLALAQSRRAEELQESEARAHLATEVAGLGTYDVELSTHNALWSPRFRAIFGLPPDTKPNLEHILSCLHPDDRERFATRVQDHDTQSDPAHRES